MRTKLTPAMLKAMAPTCPWERAKALAGPINDAADAANIPNDGQFAAFIGVLAHESDGFRALAEYASGMAYEGRQDLGNTQPGDGARYKGRGLIQLTGRANYARMSKLLNTDFIGRPDLLEDPIYAAMSAGQYWSDNKLGDLCRGPVVETIQFDQVSAKVNTGSVHGIVNHKDERRTRWMAVKRVLENPVTLARPYEAQDALSRLKYYDGAVDGMIGPKTRAAIRSFQEDRGIIPATGDLDEKTLTALLPPEGYVDDGGNLKRESIDDSRIVKDGEKGKVGTVIVGAGAAVAPVGTALLSADWKVALIFSVLLIVGGVFVYRCFGGIIKNRVEMWAKGIA